MMIRTKDNMKKKIRNQDFRGWFIDSTAFQYNKMLTCKYINTLQGAIL